MEPGPYVAEFDRCPGCEKLEAMIEGARKTPGSKHGLRAILWPRQKGEMSG